MPVSRKNKKTINNQITLRNKLIFEKGDIQLLEKWSKMSEIEKINYLKKAHKDKKI
ncbi:MAG: hypothetical protein PHR26_00300 [Candidatus ainarchaeum sp.]|nr:hypothetical protein [Candidatus ainarchaeum sp.]MDD3975655.1 hypothetical protein [Candidatus ainarchaeum sp.]